MAWRPGQRAQERALEAAYEDVPPHLAQPLWDWAEGAFLGGIYNQRFERLPEIAIRLRISLPSNGTSALQRLLELCNADDGFMLDLVEAVLELYAWDDGRAGELRQLLESANSAYAVSSSYRSLELRVVPEVKDQVQAVVNAATGSPGDHLRNAWNEAYGRRPDASKAYGEAIKAVEAAMAPVINPQNLRQTLGTMIKDVENKPSKWEFEVADGRATGVGTVLAMMQVLWDGQTSRHGGVNPTRLETAEEARAAVHLAATLIQFAVGKLFRVA